jgi:hypothetical protein
LRNRYRPFHCTLAAGDRRPGRPAIDAALPPIAPQFGVPTLGLPVDGGVGAANLAGAPAAAPLGAAPSAAPSILDLNALPPTLPASRRPLH